MVNDFWLNLPVKNISRSKEFFAALGFAFSTGPGATPTSAPLLVGNKKIVVMLFEETVFRQFVDKDIADTTKHCQVLLSFGVSRKEEVDDLAAKAVAAGGSSMHVPSEMNSAMYGCVFSDLDGHQWNVLYFAGQ